MNMISTMSLAGTVSLACYYAAKLAFRDQYSVHGKMILLKISIFFYLCPFQFIKYFLPENVTEYLPDFYKIRVGDSFHFGQAGYVTVHHLSGEYVSYPVWKIAVTLLWLAAAVTFVSYEVVQYFRMKRLVAACSEEIEPGQSIFLTEKEWKRDKKKYHIRILSSSVVDSPFTIGVIKPIIFMPETELEEDEYGMIYQHEITHIKKRDIPVKFLCLTVILLHWFNPLSYLVLREFNTMSEYCCDETIMKKRDIETRKKYARLLIRFAVEQESSSKTFWTKSFFKKGEKILEKRVGVILDMKKKKSLIIVLMAIVSVMLGTMTVYAYKAENVIQVTDDFVIGSDDWLAIYSTEDSFIPNFTASDNVFVTNDGDSYPIYSDNFSEPYVLCIHAYKDGSFYAHKTNSNGGCEVRKYSAQICSKCGKTVVGDWLSTTIYAKCPH